ncbi:hypothetical protein pb186bvf_021200 [Paramecium bursaria]
MQTDQGRNHNYQPLNSNILEDRSSNRSINQRFGNLNIGSEHSQANQPLIGQVQDQISIQSQNQVVDPIRQVEDVQSQGDSQPPQQFMGFQERDQALEEIEERIKERLEKEIYERVQKEIQDSLKKERQEKIEEKLVKQKKNNNQSRKKQSSVSPQSYIHQKQNLKVNVKVQGVRKNISKQKQQHKYQRQSDSQSESSDSQAEHSDSQSDQSDSQNDQHDNYMDSESDQFEPQMDQQDSQSYDDYY